MRWLTCLLKDGTKPFKVICSDCGNVIAYHGANADLDNPGKLFCDPCTLKRCGLTPTVRRGDAENP